MILPAGGDRVFPIMEKAPVDISHHIGVPVGDLCLEELLASSYQHIGAPLFLHAGQLWSAMGSTGPGRLGGLLLAGGAMIHAS
eukprot:2781003-Ditylum_brightwellii.AAC.1